MCRIGITSYINAYPFLKAFDPQELLFDVPANLNTLFREKKLDIALISSVAVTPSDFLTPFGIGASSSIYSVNLYVKKEEAPLRCKVTKESAASVALLKTLCHHFWKKELTIVEDDYNALLLIGNEALENQEIPGYTTIDLARTWREKTGLGFVFAFFAAHENSDKVKQFCQKCEDSLHWSETHLDEILAMALKKSTHSSDFLRRYYRSHSYRLTPLEKQGFDYFSTLYV